MANHSDNHAIWKCAAAVLGVLIVMAFAGLVLLLLWPDGNGGKSSVRTEKEELQASGPLEAEQKIKDQIQISGTGEPVDEEEEELDGDYILPDSSSRLLTDADIEGLSARELNYAKNEIYARHGRIFDSPELREYFESKSWYEGEYTAEEFDAESGSILNENEKKNAEFLSDAENELEPGGYQLDQ